MSRASQFERLKTLSDRPYPALTVQLGRRYLARYLDDGFVLLWVGNALVELRRFEEAEQSIAKALEHCPDKVRQIFLAHMGHLYVACGNSRQAAIWYRQAIEADPNDSKYHVYLGCVLANQGRLADAENSFRMAVQCSDGCLEEAYYNLGFTLTARNRFEEAAVCYREALAREPNYRLARRALRDVERCLRLQ